MHNHRIVPEGADEYDGRSCGYDVGINKKDEWIREERFHYNKFDTIPMPSEWTAKELVVLAEITLAEWETIYDSYGAIYRLTLSSPDLIFWIDWHRSHPFSQYLSDLISLTPLKGLTVEEIRKLNEVKK